MTPTTRRPTDFSDPDERAAFIAGAAARKAVREAADRARYHPECEECGNTAVLEFVFAVDSHFHYIFCNVCGATLDRRFTPYPNVDVETW